MELKNQFDPDLRKIIKNQKKATIIPIGSIEQHGAHLPVSTDSDIVTYIAKRTADMGGFLLLPTISYGVSFEHAPFFNLSIKGSTLQKMIFEICVSLSKNGIKTVFIINGHYSNERFLKRLPILIRRYTRGKTRVFVFSYWYFMSQRFDHAGFVETSLMCAISSKVNMKKAKKGLITDALPKHKVALLNKLASKSFTKVTKSGVWGDPRRATIHDGNKILTEIVRNLVKVCQTCLTEKNRKLHH
jgi:creatinine amidohydrolase